MQIKPFVIGIIGLSGSGKTFYVNALRKAFVENITIVGFDDYYKPLEFQWRDEFGEVNYDLPAALFSERFYNDLRDLIAYKSVKISKYHFENYDVPEEIILVHPSPILVVEGLFVLDYPEIDALLDYRIFINCDLDLCFNRRLDRDIKERGIPLKRSIHQWEYHVIPAFNTHILPHKERCNLVIENSGPADTHIQFITKQIYSQADATVLEKLSRN